MSILPYNPLMQLKIPSHSCAKTTRKSFSIRARLDNSQQEEQQLNLSVLRFTFGNKSTCCHSLAQFASTNFCSSFLKLKSNTSVWLQGYLDSTSRIYRDGSATASARLLYWITSPFQISLRQHSWLAIGIFFFGLIGFVFGNLIWLFVHRDRKF